MECIEINSPVRYYLIWFNRGYLIFNDFTYNTSIFVSCTINCLYSSDGGLWW